MPREATITYDQVAAIANGMKAAGEKPSPREIRLRHGSGSLGTIHKLLQQWDATSVRQAEVSLALSPALQRAIQEFVDQQRNAARSELEVALSSARATADDLASENERLTRGIEATEGVLAELKAETHTLAGRVEQLEADLSATKQDAEMANRAAEGARTELAKAELRLEAMPALEQEMARLRQALDAERKIRTDAEREAATAEAKAAGVVDRLADTRTHLQESLLSTKELRDALAHTTEQLALVQAARAEESFRSAERIGRLEGTVATLEKQREAAVATLEKQREAAVAATETHKGAPAEVGAPPDYSKSKSTPRS